MSAPRLVESESALHAALEVLSAAPWVAVDTEFLRERTYYPQLCVVQLASDETDFVIDTLAVEDLGPLGEFLAESRQVKIFHAARQDLEALQRGGITVGSSLFDTQTAATLVGKPDQVSYAWLVAHYCGVVLDKSQTRTDWTRRPLTEAQLLYAQDDVRYLGPLYLALREALQTAGKLEWLWEETAAVTASVQTLEDPTEAWRRIRALGALPPLAAARGRALAAWRERTAQRLDIPRGWLLKDDVLIAVAMQDDLTLATLAAIPGMTPATVRRHGDELLRTQADAAADAVAPAWRISPEGNALLGELQAYVKSVASEIEVSPGLLASRKDLEGLLVGEPPARLLGGWRAPVCGAWLAARVAEVPLAHRRQPAGGNAPRARRS